MRGLAVALIVVGLLILLVAASSHFGPVEAKGDSSVDRDSPPGADQSYSPPQQTTTVPSGAGISGGTFRVRLLDSKGNVLRSGSSALSVFVDSAGTKEIFEGRW